MTAEYEIQHNAILVYEDAGFGGKYTKANAGQCKFEGWTTAGKNRYKVIRNANKEGRKTEDSAKLEAAILAQIRHNLGIQAATYAELKKSLKRKRVEDSEEEVEDVDGDGDIFMDDDEE